jgi:hypothetical protein
MYLAQAVQKLYIFLSYQASLDHNASLFLSWRDYTIYQESVSTAQKYI